MKFIKKYYLLLLLIITLTGVSIYGTYAMFTSSVESNMVNMDTYMNYTFDINGTQELKVSAGSKLRFNAIVKNSMNGKISYGMYYKMISPTTLPSGVIIAQVSDDLTVLAKGQLEKGTQTTVPMVIKNTSDSEIIVEIGVRTGYATDNQGVDDIIYNEGEVPITSFQTSAEAGNDSCTSTKTCTSECVERIENGYKNTYCYCLDSSVEYNPAKETLEKLGLTANEGVPDFSQIATTDEGIYAAPDDYGTSYYFRGAVDNNWISFAGFYWRIIRINGDGSIRLIYSGIDTGRVTNANRIGEGTQIGVSAFNNLKDDNAYVGYMYGTSGSNTYEETHSNIHDSTIKITLDTWFENNLLDYSQYISRDMGFCGDREVSYDLSDGNGTGRIATYYKGMERNISYSNPSFKCNQVADFYTIKTSIKGNKVLNYPVGLITADEVLYAGGIWGTENIEYYLYTQYSYYSMTPTFYSSAYSLSDVFYINTCGNLDFNYGVNGIRGVRPVINLKADILFSGNGTSSSPFEVIS